MNQLASKIATRSVGGRSRALDVDRYVSLRIRQRRIMLGLTQQQMAELIGVTYQQAHKYETGINRISWPKGYSGKKVRQQAGNWEFLTILLLGLKILKAYRLAIKKTLQQSSIIISS
jgi:DNA-binding XRE family transcriptional regulator